MNPIKTLYFILILIGIQACGPRKEVQKTPTRYDAPVEKKNDYVPFTKDLYNKLLANRIDLKKVQFFIDQELVFTRGVDNGKVEVSNGVIKFINGKYVNEIVLPIYTPGVCELVEGDGLRISFEKGGQAFKFLNSRQYSPDYFVFTGSNWKDGSCEVDYDGNKYRVNCGTCSSAADAKLVVRQSDIDNNERKSKQMGGNKVTGR
jgi:hypothetical protein